MKKPEVEQLSNINTGAFFLFFGDIFLNFMKLLWTVDIFLPIFFVGDSEIDDWWRLEQPQYGWIQDV